MFPDVDLGVSMFVFLFRSQVNKNLHVKNGLSILFVM